MKKNCKHLLALSFATVFILSGCKMSEEPLVGKGLDSMMGKKDQTERRLSTAAAEAISAGKSDEALLHYAELYKKNAKDSDIALNYAQLLRKAGKPAQSRDVLAPFLKDRNGKDAKYVAPVILNQLAASEIDLGDFENAEKHLNRVLEDEKAEGLHADAYNLMGIVLDARGNHREAEQMFRIALEKWKGNPTSVMNNLALCLAGQGMFDESIITLRKALLISPEKDEISRNIEIVTNLRDSVIPAAPTKLK